MTAWLAGGTVLLSLLLNALAGAARTPTMSALEAFAQRLQRACQAYEKVNDYTATLHVQERFDDRLNPPARGLLKFRKPFSVYLKWESGPNAGVQVLYVRGAHEGRVLVRPAGLLGLKTFRLVPTGSLAMRGNRHPVTETGIGSMIQVLETNRRRAVAEGRAQVVCLPTSPDAEPPGVRFELTVTGRETPGYYCRRAVVTFDEKTGLLIAAQAYDWNNRLIEDYRFLDLRTNVGLTDRDFDPANPAYKFE